MAQHVPSNQVAYYAQAIKENWQQAVDGIFAVCSLVAEFIKWRADIEANSAATEHS